MNDKEEKQILIIALLIYALICLLFFGLVAFGYVSVPAGGQTNNNNTSNPSTVENVTGTVFYNDGTTPFVLDDTSVGSQLKLFNQTDMSVISTFVTDSTGKFTSPDVPAGDYILSAYSYNVPQGQVLITIPANSTLLQNLTTYRVPKN